MSDVIDHAEELETRIMENCRARWDGYTEDYDIPNLDRAYAELLIAQLALESQDKGIFSGD